MKPGSWREVEEIFQEALQRDRAQRDAFVRDTDLHREVSSLLANHEEARLAGAAITSVAM